MAGGINLAGQLVTRVFILNVKAHDPVRTSLFWRRRLLLSSGSPPARRFFVIPTLLIPPSSTPAALCFTAGAMLAESCAQTTLADTALCILLELIYFFRVKVSILCVCVLFNCVLADGDRETKADHPLDVKPALQSTASLKVTCWPVDQPESRRAVMDG